MNDAMVQRIVSSLPEGMLELRRAFLRHGFDIRVVGGAVRDAAAGTMPKDIDLCTNATPDEQEAIYRANNVRCIPTGLKHGTWTVVLEGEPVEITSLRVDLKTDGRHAEVEWTHDWVKDLSRRDLTINAMSMTLDGEVIDPFDGMDDLHEGRVRFVGNAGDRMQEDYLRILRWLRFEGRFGSGTADIEAMKAAVSCRDGLSHISRERVWSEFKRILAGPRGYDMVHLAVTLGLDRPCGLEVNLQSLSMFYEMGVHDPVALLVRSVPDIRALATEWKWSGEERNLAVWISQRYDHDSNPKKMVAAEGQRRDWVSILLTMQGRPAEAEEILDWKVPVFPVTGHDVEAMGIPRGRDVGVALARMKDKWSQTGYELDADALLEEERSAMGLGSMRP